MLCLSEQLPIKLLVREKHCLALRTGVAKAIAELVRKQFHESVCWFQTLRAVTCPKSLKVEPANEIVQIFRFILITSFFFNTVVEFRVKVSDFCVIVRSLHYPMCSFEEGFYQHSIFFSLAFSCSTRESVAAANKNTCALIYMMGCSKQTTCVQVLAMFPLSKDQPPPKVIKQNGEI